MEQSYLQFLRFGMGVVLGTLLLQASETMLEEHVFWTSPRLLLQLISTMIFIELWLIITTYHEVLKIKYRGEVLFVDLLLLSLPFMFSVREMGQGTEHLPHALLVLAVILLLLFLRQAFPFRESITDSKELEKLLNTSKNDSKELQEKLQTSENDSKELQEKLQTSENNSKKLQKQLQALSEINDEWLREHLKTSMMADWFGVCLCYVTAMAASSPDKTYGLHLLTWTWIGFGSVSIYMLFFRFRKYVLIFQPPIRLTPKAKG